METPLFLHFADWRRARLVVLIHLALTKRVSQAFKTCLWKLLRIRKISILKWCDVWKPLRSDCRGENHSLLWIHSQSGMLSYYPWCLWAAAKEHSYESFKSILPWTKTAPDTSLQVENYAEGKEIKSWMRPGEGLCRTCWRMEIGVSMHKQILYFLQKKILCACLFHNRMKVWALARTPSLPCSDAVVPQFIVLHCLIS